MDALIIADDLSGAADCAAACGTDAIVTLEGLSDSAARVVAIDIDSRDRSAEIAAARARAALDGMGTVTELVYQKLDSTLRGNWAVELDALAGRLAALRGRHQLVVLCPAFPERGRTVVGGTVRVDGQALTGPSIAMRLAATGRPAEVIPPNLGAEGLRDALEAAAEARRVAVCDAEDRRTLDAIATAALHRSDILWAGSAGLMGSLAWAAEWRDGPRSMPPHHSAPTLVVVGSASAVSRRQVEHLAKQAGVAVIACPAALLSRGDPSAFEAIRADVAAAARETVCVVVTIEGPADSADPAGLVAGLADLLVPLLPRFGGLVMTGGETARALLSRAGVRAIRILGEVEPGVPFGQTIGALDRPIVTKAGGFGVPDTLTRAVRLLAGAAVQIQGEQA